MKKRVVLELPLGLANWLLSECEFHHAMLKSNLIDIECLGSFHRPIKNQILRNLDSYSALWLKLSSSIAKVLRK